MKKLIFGLMATVVFSSLSFGQEFKELYYNYKKSTEMFYSKLDDFDKNLNLEVDDPSVFKSEGSFKQWLEVNISKTNFKEPEQALKDYNELIEMEVEIIKNNIDFLKQIEDNKNQFIDLLESSPLFGSPISSKVNSPNSTQNFPCVSDCINDAVQCNRDADNIYAAAMGGSGVGYFYNPITAGAGALIASINHHISIKKCVRQLNVCVSGCD